MRITVIGAGMGGLTAAIALKKFGHEVTVYEKTREIRPVGAAISLWSNGVKCLNYLGLHDHIAALGGNMAYMAYQHGHDGKVMTRFSLDLLVNEVGQKPYPVSRAELQFMLMDEFGRENIHLGHEMVAITQQNQQVEVKFAGGSSIVSDLVVGADGTHSLIRNYVLGKSVERRYAGYVNWNGLVQMDERIAPTDQWTIFVGEGKRVSLMPIANNRFYFFFDVPLSKGLVNDKTEYQSDLRKYFKGWCEPVQRLIDQIDPQSTNRVEIHDLEPITQWVRGHVVLLGDAAHSTTPDIGQGGCQAMEDAVYLAQSLQINTLSVADALNRYQHKRSKRANELVLRARRRCDVTHMKDSHITEQWYQELWQEQGDHIMRGIVNNIVGNPLD